MPMDNKHESVMDEESNGYEMFEDTGGYSSLIQLSADEKSW
jgi:hypothetical protein